MSAPTQDEGTEYDSRAPFDVIKAEMVRQNKLWGDPSHSPLRWYVILAEEVGELAQAVNQDDMEHAREELIQVAATAANWVRLWDAMRVETE